MKEKGLSPPVLKENGLLVDLNSTEAELTVGNYRNTQKVDLSKLISIKSSINERINTQK